MPMPSVPVFDDDYYEAAAERMAFDLAVLRRVTRDVALSKSGGAAATVVFPLNFRTYCVPEYYKQYVRALRDVPPVLAASLMPKFVRIPAGAPQSLIAEKISSLAPLFKLVLVQTPPNVELTRFGYTSRAVLTTSWRDFERLSGGVNTFDTANLLNQFCRFAAARGLKCAIEGVDKSYVADLTMAARPDFVSGEAIGASGPSLSAQTSFTADDIRARRS
jgi:hypothetical protein